MCKLHYNKIYLHFCMHWQCHCPILFIKTHMLNIASNSMPTTSCTISSQYLNSWHKDMETGTLKILFSLGLKHAKIYSVHTLIFFLKPFPYELCIQYQIDFFFSALCRSVFYPQISELRTFIIELFGSFVCWTFFL